jgi:PadR family transcriptional regulator, regulatory protein PadR
MRSEVLKGHLDLILLATVAAHPSHGYRIVEELRTRSAGAFQLSEGTVYPALYRLERAGLLTSCWDASGARKRRVYRLSRAGRRELALRREDWRSFAAAVEAVVA